MKLLYFLSKPGRSTPNRLIFYPGRARLLLFQRRAAFAHQKRLQLPGGDAVRARKAELLLELLYRVYGFGVVFAACAAAGQVAVLDQPLLQGFDRVVAAPLIHIGVVKLAALRVGLIIRRVAGIQDLLQARRGHAVGFQTDLVLEALHRVRGFAEVVSADVAVEVVQLRQAALQGFDLLTLGTVL